MIFRQYGRIIASPVPQKSRLIAVAGSPSAPCAGAPNGNRTGCTSVCNAGKMRIAKRTKVLIATLNRPATGMPWLIEAFSDGRKTDNRGGSEVQISRRPGGWDAEVFLPCSRRADDRMKLPFYFLLIRQNQTIGKEDRNYCWPPSRVVPRLRLNFSIYSPENFGCFPENQR